MNQLYHTLAKIVSSQPTRKGIFLNPALILQSYSTTTTKQSSKLEGDASTRTPQKSQSPSPPLPTQLPTLPPPPQLKSAPLPQQPTAPPSSKIVADSDFPRPSEIPFQAKIANSVNLIGYVHMPVQFESSPDGKYWAGTIITRDLTSDSPSLWIPIIFEGDLAHIAACHLKENDHICVAGKLSGDPPPFNAIQGQANVQVMVHSLDFVQGSSQMKKSSTPYKQEEGDLKHSASVKKDHSVLSSWRDLLDNPGQWWDYRKKKLSGMVNPKYPDFKHKDGGLSLWLNSAPEWVLSELKGVEFDDQINKSKQVNQRKGDESWKNLLENPDKWWDNRLNKLKERSPDFKHKETGEGLWLSDSPAWVLPKLPSPKGEQNVAIGKKWDTLLS